MPDENAQPTLDQPGRVFVVSGPSGVGKNTLVRELEKRDVVTRAVTATTREPREGEKDGEDYHFVTSDEFERWVDEGRFLEHARYCGNRYGTPVFSVNKSLETGRAVVLVIEVQGAMQIKEKYPGVRLIFIAPPSEQELRRRLAGRGDEDGDTLEQRLERAREELDYAKHYDHVIENDSVQRAADELEELIRLNT